MPNPTLSIIVPVYNMEKYVERCIRSILSQSFSDYELLIIDDGSEDKSCEVIKTLVKDDPRVHLFEYPNGGVSVARNRGLDHVKGKYVVFIDADDYISDNYLLHIMSQVNNHEADIYIWGITKNRLNGKEITIVPSLSGSYSKFEFLKEFVLEQYKTHKGLYGYISNKLLKSDIISSTGIRFNDSMKLMEDYDFFLRYYKYCRYFYCFDETGYHYVAYSSNTGKNKRNVNYVQLIDTHIKCRLLLKENDALTDGNDVYLKKAIGDLSISAFLEMEKVTLSDIKQLSDQIHQRDISLQSLSSLNTRKRKLKKWILNKDINLIFVYLLIWKTYLKFQAKK